MSQVEVPNYLKKWEFGDSASYAKWPKVADMVIEALFQHGEFGLDHGIGHFASMSPQNNEQLTPIKG